MLLAGHVPQRLGSVSLTHVPRFERALDLFREAPALVCRTRGGAYTCLSYSMGRTCERHDPHPLCGSFSISCMISFANLHFMAGIHDE